MSIRDYVQHKPDCQEGNLIVEYPTGNPKGTAPCSCGLDEALRRVEELEAALLAADTWLLLPSDTYPQHQAELSRVRKLVRAALTADQGSEE